MMEEKKIKFCDKCGEAYQTDKLHECITIATLCRDLVLSLCVKTRGKLTKSQLEAEILINNDRIANVSVDIHSMVKGEIEALRSQVKIESDNVKKIEDWVKRTKLDPQPK